MTNESLTDGSSTEKSLTDEFLMDESLVDEYLARIGAERPARADAEALRHLQERHALSVPFENLDYYFGEPIHLDPRILEKVVRRRRGGGCYEVNPALGHLLAALGFRVELVPARVFIAGELGVPMGHVVLRVELDGEFWLVDVGFGRNSRWPIPLGSAEVQHDPHGEYQVTPVEGGHELRLNGSLLYRIDDRPVQARDLRATLWWYRTQAGTPFLQGLICTLPTADGRITLSGRTLTRQVGEERVKEELADDADLLDAFRKYFGIDIHELPGELDVDPAGAVRVRPDHGRT